ncbi:MAG: NUDIX hydrolase domain-like protein [Monoraphidium minutum]|nr:MAG: NUDIX hydrolase domain-like protein [Monoraphidium minutum]
MAEAGAPAAAATAPPTSQQRPRVGLGVFVERGDGSGAFCLGQRINSLGHGEWALPGGHLEFGEQFEECAVREVEEETGLKITGVRLAAVENVVFESGGAHYVVIFMRGVAAPGAEPRVLEPTKCTAWRWATWADLPAQLFQPLRQLAARGFSLSGEVAGGAAGAY